jgi:hypothetical protein
VRRKLWLAVDHAVARLEMCCHAAPLIAALCTTPTAPAQHCTSARKREREEKVWIVESDEIPKSRSRGSTGRFSLSAPRVPGQDGPTAFGSSGRRSGRPAPGSSIGKGSPCSVASASSWPAGSSLARRVRWPARTPSCLKTSSPRLLPEAVGGR